MGGQESLGYWTLGCWVMHRMEDIEGPGSIVVWGSCGGKGLLEFRVWGVRDLPVVEILGSRGVAYMAGKAGDKESVILKGREIAGPIPWIGVSEGGIVPAVAWRGGWWGPGPGPGVAMETEAHCLEEGPVPERPEGRGLGKLGHRWVMGAPRGQEGSCGGQGCP